MKERLERATGGVTEERSERSVGFYDDTVFFMQGEDGCEMGQYVGVIFDFCVVGK